MHDLSHPQDRSPPQSHIEILENQAAYGIRSAITSLQRRSDYKHKRHTAHHIHTILSTTGALLRTADGSTVVVKMPKAGAASRSLKRAAAERANTHASWAGSCWACVASLYARLSLFSTAEA